MIYSFLKYQNTCICTLSEQTLAASTSFAVASANTFAAARRRFCESESSSVSASALIPVTNEDDACIEYKISTNYVLFLMQGSTYI